MISLFTFDASVFFLIGIFSMLMHCLKKWANGEIKGKWLDWYWVHPRATVGAVLACLGGIATAILSGALNDFTVGAQVIAASGIGYASDTLNTQGRR